MLLKAVAPHVGAWIETSTRHSIALSALVAPHVGAWIETLTSTAVLRRDRSRPTWARGLKLAIIKRKGVVIKVAPHVGAWIETYSLLCSLVVTWWSRPTWARGLKLLRAVYPLYIPGRAPRGRVD